MDEIDVSSIVVSKKGNVWAASYPNGLWAEGDTRDDALDALIEEIQEWMLYMQGPVVEVKPKPMDQ